MGQNAPLNPILHRSLVFGYYMIYCGNKDKLKALCGILGFPKRGVRWNELFRVYEITTSENVAKSRIDEVFVNGMMLYMGD